MISDNENESLRLKTFLDAAPVAFGKHLSALRKIKGWSQEKLALEAGMARSYLGGIERGQRNLSLKNLVKLAECMHIPLPMLMNFSVDPVSQIGQLQTIMQDNSQPLSNGCFDDTAAPANASANAKVKAKDVTPKDSHAQETSADDESQQKTDR